jgi:hypothetical protein
MHCGLAIAIATLGCAPSNESAGTEPTRSLAASSGHDQSAVAVLDGTSALRAALAGGQLVFAPPAGQPTFVRVGLRYDAAGGDPELELRVARADGWSDWERAPITFNRGELYNAHLELASPAEAVALRPASGAAGELRFLAVELFELALPPRPSATASELGSVQQALAPSSLVHPRSDWGAAPTADCGAWHTPRHVTIHHTVTPNNDPTPPADRIKGIQSYHINSNGWCDIGYHFLVSQDGDRWQGWKTEEKSGIHVGNHNTDNVGISFLGSYHIAQPPQAQVDGVVPLVKWLADNYGIGMDRDHVLGHQEWSGQSTACPGSFLLARLDEIIGKVQTGDKESHVEIGVGWSPIPGQQADFIAGSSAGIFDVLVGQEIEGSVIVRNGSARPQTDSVSIGYLIEAPFLQPLSYVIEHDLPAKDGQTFVTSPADANPANPLKHALPAEGALDVGVLEPGESVRIRFQLRAATYSFGVADHPDLRAWVRHVGGYYGEQESWDDPVELNQAGTLLRAFAQADVLSPHEWRFDGPAGEDLEGWSIGADLSDLALNLVDGALAMKASGADPIAISPSFTRIDAARFSQLRLRARQHGEVRQAKLYFRRDGEAYSEDRHFPFSTSGGGTWDEVVLEASSHPEWSGSITGLRLDPWEGDGYEGAEAWFDIDWLRADGELEPPVGGGGGAWGAGAGSGTASGGSGVKAPGGSSDDEPAGSCLCETRGSRRDGGGALAALLAGLFAVRRRRPALRAR